jgi:hypothetical protein
MLLVLFMKESKSDVGDDLSDASYLSRVKER